MPESLKWQREFANRKQTLVNPQQLGKRIRQAREKLGLSQDDLAERVGRDQRAVSEYESGKRRIYAHDLPTFADALSVPVVYFFRDADAADDKDEMLLDVFHQFGADERGIVLEIMRLLARLLRRRQ